MSYPNYPSGPGSGYPGGYPPGQYPGYPQAQPTSYPAYPGSQSVYPGYPVSQSVYPGYSGNSVYPGYPGNSVYPPQQHQHQVQYVHSVPAGYSQPTLYEHSITTSSNPAYQAYPSYPQQQQTLVTRMEHHNPTVHPAEGFNARSDADALHKAMKGLGTNEQALIDVLCHRTSFQRCEIARAYKAGYGKDLQSKIKSEVSGNFERVLVALCKSPADFLAGELHEAVKGLGTEEGTLVEILCSRTNNEILEIKEAYKRLYGHDVEKDIKGDTSGTLQMLLVSLVQGNRDENHGVDAGQVKQDVDRLYKAGEGKFGTDESSFNCILATRSWPFLRQLCHEYHALRGKDLEEVVKSEFSANAEKGMLAIIQCAKNRSAYFAYRLNNAIKGAGTKDRALIRIIVSRCDIDLADIKHQYHALYGRSLPSDVSGDTTGDYKKALLALVA